jgi:leucyl/phenylalanyl-tRNA--protein transferase
VGGTQDAGLKISHSLAKTIRQDKFHVTSDAAFGRVIQYCAEAAMGREETWINQDIQEAFLKLHELGHAHSVECWLDGAGGPQLVGGLYGVSVSRVFCGESMFSRANDASKVALAWLVARLRLGGYELLDCQFMTDHLASLGATEISQRQYVELLQAAVRSGFSPDQLVSTVGSSVASTAVSGASPAAFAPAESGADWGVLDGFLTAALAGESPSLTGAAVSSSPGKLILHSLTQIS